ncbi:MAG TPA: AI-2E family transporter [Casimicrobiaceae bacterium]|nr:AI-2E family transporter [Casimicrobiaceae bacterium]
MGFALETTEGFDAADATFVATAPPDAKADAKPDASASSPAATESPGTGVRTSALVIIALVLILAAVRFAEAFFIPLVISVFLSYALSPLVARLEAWHVPRALGAAFVVLVFVALCGAAVYRAGSDAVELLELLPQAVEKVRVSFTAWQRDGVNPLHHVRETAAELEKLAVAAEKLAVAAQPPAAGRAPKPAAPAAPTIDMRSVLLMGTGSAIFAAGQLFSVLFLTFFLLAAGHLFRRKLMQVVGPSFERRKVTVRILDDMHRVNQHYFAVVLVINIAVGIATGIAMYAIGVDRALVWGVAAAILHTIPYLGAAALAAAAGLAAYVQLGSLGSALAAIGLVLAIAGALGVGLQTWLMGRAARMNAPAVFISLLFWGMLWGAWGLLLAVPIMVAVKTACDHIEPLHGWGALLGP